MVLGQLINRILPAANEVLATHRCGLLPTRGRVINRHLRRKAFDHGRPAPLIKGKEKLTEEVVDLQEDGRIYSFQKYAPVDS